MSTTSNGKHVAPFQYFPSAPSMTGTSAHALQVFFLASRDSTRRPSTGMRRGCRLRPPDGSPIPRHPGKKFEVARAPAWRRISEEKDVGFHECAFSLRSVQVRASDEQMNGSYSFFRVLFTEQILYSRGKLGDRGIGIQSGGGY